MSSKKKPTIAKTTNPERVKNLSAARQYVEGKSTEDLLRIGSANIQRMSTEKLQAVVTRLASAGNKRLRRAQDAGLDDSPAIRAVEASGGRFSGKGKDRDALIQEYIRIRDFYKDPTSTQEGWKREKKRIEKAMGKSTKKPAPAPGPSGSGTPVPPPVTGQIQDADPIIESITGGGYPDPEPTPWEADGWKLSDDGTWEHEIFGSGWELQDDGSMVDPATGNVARSRDRMYHDYDSTQDWRVTPTGTETGDIWAMIDSLARLDARFARRVGDSGATAPRTMLFNALDDAWTENPGWSLEDARDSLFGEYTAPDGTVYANRLDYIYSQWEDFIGDAADLGGMWM